MSAPEDETRIGTPRPATIDSSEEMRVMTKPMAGTPRGPVSSWWRVVAVVLLASLVVITILPFALEKTSVRTAVEWFRFSAPGGPGTAGTNLTKIPPDTFCAPSGALSVGLFSMTWTASNGTRLADVRLWTLDSNLPFPYVLFLYHGYNESSGGTSFESPYPIPCGNMWVLDDSSSVTVTVSAVMTLAYNYTATTYPFL